MHLDHSRAPRRSFLAGVISATAALVAGCKTARDTAAPAPGIESTELDAMYGPETSEKFPIPAVNLKHIETRFLRSDVEFDSDEPPGTVVVDTKTFFLYLIGHNRRARRYGVGLGRAGFEWSGQGNIAWKRKWPTWTPPEEMIARQPELAQWSAANGGMKPGLRNPLGARALYIFKDGKDTLYRLHGTLEARTIGKAVSSGCVRLLNQDVIDLYERVKPGAPIIVI